MKKYDRLVLEFQFQDEENEIVDICIYDDEENEVITLKENDWDYIEYDYIDDAKKIEELKEKIAKDIIDNKLFNLYWYDELWELRIENKIREIRGE